MAPGKSNKAAKAAPVEVEEPKDTEYPKALYKGDVHSPEHKERIVQDPEDEQKWLKKGYVDLAAEAATNGPRSAPTKRDDDE